MDPTGGISGEVGKTARGFFEILKESPLSLSLVVVIFALSFMLYYSAAATLEQRSVMAKMIVEWQQQQQVILAGCVSADVTKNMMDNMQKITDTMLTYNNKEITRMQEAIDKERDRSFQLRERREQDLLRPQNLDPIPLPRPRPIGAPELFPLQPVEEPAKPVEEPK